MKRTAHKRAKRAGTVPAVLALVSIAFVGGAFVKQGAEKRRASARLEAQQMEEGPAQAIAKELEDAFRSVEMLAAEAKRRPRTGKHKRLTAEIREQEREQEREREIARAKPLLASESWSLDLVPVNAFATEGLPAEDLPTDPDSEARFLIETPQVFAPLQTAGDGEEAMQVRLLVVSERGRGAPRSIGWAVASVKMVDLVRSSGLGKLSSSGYDYQLSRTGPGGAEQSLARSTALAFETPVRKIISLAADKWTLSISPNAGWSPRAPLILQGVFVLILALAGSVSAYDRARRRHWFVDEIEQSSLRLRLANRRLVAETRRREGLEEQFGLARSYDPSTGLPNRRHFMNQLRRTLERSKRRQGLLLAVMKLELDRSKNGNLSSARSGGERRILAANRLRACLPPSELVLAHIGGDEFLALLPDILSHRKALAAAAAFQQGLADPIPLVGQEVPLTASIGISLSSTGLEHPDDLIRGATEALSKAKDLGPGGWAVCAPAEQNQTAADGEEADEADVQLGRKPGRQPAQKPARERRDSRRKATETRWAKGKAAGR